jgi:hypothetical protein
MKMGGPNLRLKPGWKWIGLFVSLREMDLINKRVNHNGDHNYSNYIRNLIMKDIYGGK